MDEEIQNKIPEKLAKSKNKASANVQITAEQLLREAYEKRTERIALPPKPKPKDAEEAEAITLATRKDFEDRIRKNRLNLAVWFKYAKFEESYGEIDRARSIYERALQMDHRNITIWLRYTEMEMRHKQINHARNLWDRAVLILPRCNQFWYKYTYMEELLGNIQNARQVFERWMQWNPHEQAWLSYIKLEIRYKEVNRARAIYERFVTLHSDSINWIRFAKFEERTSSRANARIVYEKAVEFFTQNGGLMEPKLMLAFAKFEESCNELERAKVIYKFCLENMPKAYITEIIEEYSKFEKKHGDKRSVDDVIVNKRKAFYEQQLEENPNNIDVWFELLVLLENEEYSADKIRDYYEKAIANIPEKNEKKYWRRYIYLWIKYAIFEELVLKDYERTRKIYTTCLEVIPHKQFTFAKIWIMFADFEIRHKNYDNFRKILGTAIGKCPKDKLFKEYIKREFQLREFARCRQLYDKYVNFNVHSCLTWIKYAEMENMLGNTDRSRSIFNLAIQYDLHMPEVLWKSYIDFELSHNEIENCRKLYKELLERTKHYKIWLNYAKFELSNDEINGVDSARKIFMQGCEYFKNFYNQYKTNSLDPEDIENVTIEDVTTQRIALLQAWEEFENQYGDEKIKSDLQKELPKKMKKKRKIIQLPDDIDQESAEFGWEEYYEYVFPEDIETQSNYKLLQMAHKWKMKEMKE